MLELAAWTDERKGAADYAARAIEWLRKQPQPPQERQQSERTIRALEAKAARRYQEAYDLTSGTGADRSRIRRVFIAGLAALELERWEDASRHLQTYIDFGPGLLILQGHDAVGRIMLARAQGGAGRLDEARRSYQHAFRIWRRADTDLPLLAEARREYQRLPDAQPTR